MNVQLDHKIGQMLLIGFRGLELDAENPILADIRDRHLGGVVLFDYDVAAKSPIRNIHSPEQVKHLVASLQEYATTPLFIAIDQEGGKVNRLKQCFGFPPSVSAQYLGSVDRLDITKKHADLTARTLAGLGINLNFAPTVDLNTYPDNPIIGNIERSFSADAKVVIRHARQWIASHHKHKVLCTLKHFPGHGSSRSDTHLGFVNVTDFWSTNELVPYYELLRSGFQDLVMTAHIFNATNDPELPATLSRKTITGILREHLGYEGLVISDDMQMKAISARYSLEETVKYAIDAGIDILTFGNNLNYDPHIMARIVAIIKNFVTRGIISEQRIDASYQRICRLKAESLLL